MEKGLIHKTIRCLVDRGSSAKHKDELMGLFEAFGTALKCYLELIPLRAPRRDAFRPEDYQTVKAKAPGLHADLIYHARDRAIQMWRTYLARKRADPKTGIPGQGRNYDPHPRAIPMDLRTLKLSFEHPEDKPLEWDLIASIPVPDLEAAIPNSSVDKQKRIRLKLTGKGHQHELVRAAMENRDGIEPHWAELVRTGDKKTSSGTEEFYINILVRKRPHLVVTAHPSELAHLGQEQTPSVSDHVSSYQTIPLIIGVDLGLVNLFVAVAPELGMRGVKFLKGGEVRQKWRIFETRKCLFLDQNNKTGLARVDADIENYNTDLVRKIASEIISFAKNLAGATRQPILVLEDLWFEDISRSEGSAEGRHLDRDQQAELKAWPFRRIMRAIIDKAAWEGVSVVIIPSKGSSTECPRCGSTDAVRKRDVHRLVCPDCGYRANDDFCAAKVLALRFQHYLEEQAKQAAMSMSSMPSVPSILDRVLAADTLSSRRRAISIGGSTQPAEHYAQASEHHTKQPSRATDPAGRGEVGEP